MIRVSGDVLLNMMINEPASLFSNNRFEENITLPLMSKLKDSKREI